MKMLISSLLIPLSQGPLSTVHWMIVSPTDRLATTVLGSFASTKVPVPCSIVQVPIAGNVTGLPLS